ncbi:hypothetical protein [Cellulomonas fimi]|uniref:DUF8094 domain-containing protein n=1 Tax=Cellulomonas fimi TaxID=1708 RepID=A0A7Y0QH66_CELFI|nr:hypothetical protein [Cellulomonas fimi]NMR19965.1 hypothetical protein [Cellulomonas fimi]
MDRTTRTRRRAAAWAAVAALVLSACAPTLPEPQPADVPAVPPPAVTPAQAERVLDAVGATLTTADAALSTDGLDARLSGPALASRTAEYAVTSATAGAKGLTPVPTSAQTLVVPNTQEWPRVQLVVTEQPDDLSSPRLLVLQQASPRSQYMLWGWARLLPGVQMPATATADVGSTPLPPDAAGLVVAPADVASQYADLLTNGDASAFASVFAGPDSFRQGLLTGREPLAQVAAQASGTFSEISTAVPDQTFALSTADGGAIVVAAMTTTSSLTFSGATLPLPPELAAVSGGALAPGSELRSSLGVTYSDVVAFYVPPAGVQAPVEVLGAEHIRTSVTGA